MFFSHSPINLKFPPIFLKGYTYVHREYELCWQNLDSQFCYELSHTQIYQF